MAGRHHVLIVEDDPAIRDVFGEVLRSEGHSVEEVANGREAIEVLRDGGSAPCLIVADLLMPVLDGWGLAAELATVPTLASIPLVVVSAQPTSTAGTTMMPIGARARVTKPLSIDALLAIVDDFCAEPAGRRST